VVDLLPSVVSDIAGIVVRAAREYFNASGDHEDGNITLARCCLSIIKRPHAAITEELNLIAALPLLKEFNILMLPLHGEWRYSCDFLPQGDGMIGIASRRHP